MIDYFLGMDLGGTNVEVGLFDGEGNLVGRGSLATQVELGPRSLVDRVAGAFGGLLAEHVVSTESVGAVGIGSPGPLSVAEGRIIKTGNLPGFDDFALRGELSAKLGVPAVLDNDANAACWGEFWRGAGQGVTDMVMYTLGTGIGGGIIIAGELIHGVDDNAAELGHMIIEPRGRLCTCGQRGCLEAYASATHTAARAREAVESGRSSAMGELLRRDGQLTCKDVFACAEDGDGLANEIVDGTARALAQACVSMRHITEPAMAVFAGGMINAGPMLPERIRGFYEELMWTLKPEPMEICLAQLGAMAGLTGAAGLGQHAFETEQLGPVGE